MILGQLTGPARQGLTCRRIYRVLDSVYGKQNLISNAHTDGQVLQQAFLAPQKLLDFVCFQE